MEGPRYIYSQREGEMNRERRNSGMRKQQWSHLREGCVPMSPLTRSAADMLYHLSPILLHGKRWNKFTLFYFTYFYLASSQFDPCHFILKIVRTETGMAQSVK